MLWELFGSSSNVDKKKEKSIYLQKKRKISLVYPPFGHIWREAVRVGSWMLTSWCSIMFTGKQKFYMYRKTKILILEPIKGKSKGGLYVTSSDLCHWWSCWICFGLNYLEFDIYLFHFLLEFDLTVYCLVLYEYVLISASDVPFRVGVDLEKKTKLSGRLLIRCRFSWSEVHVLGLLFHPG